MSGTEELASYITIKVGGTKIENSILDLVQEVIVDQHAYLPGMFTIRLYDRSLSLLDSGPFDLTKEVQIEGKTETGKNVVLIKGEITSLEPLFEEEMKSYLVVRGYDRSHRLYRVTQSRSFLNVKDSDIASQIASAAGLSTQIEATKTVYEHIYQHNQSDLAFLMQRAWRIGYECYVEEGKLFFCTPKVDASTVTVNWGDDLLAFHPRMTLAEQVDEVNVRGWDPKKQQAIVGQASKGELYPKVGEPKNGSSWASTFGKGKLIIVDQPVVSQAEADILAQARLNELSGSFVEAEGTALRRPDIKAGKTLKLEKLGKRLSGDYLVTSASHIFNDEGLKTTFNVRGSRTGSFTADLLAQGPLDRWHGVVVAIVTNVNDPENISRVKVKYPWMSEEVESGWIRVMGPGAGPDAGFYAIPDVNDEVLIAFELGDFDRPFVLGGVWNGQQKKFPEETNAIAAAHKPLIREWRSRKKQRIILRDTPKSQIEILSAEGHIIRLDDTGKKIEIITSGGHKIIMDDNSSKIEVTSTGDLNLTATGKVNIKGATVDVNGSGAVTVKGATISLN